LKGRNFKDILQLGRFLALLCSSIILSVVVFNASCVWCIEILTNAKLFITLYTQAGFLSESFHAEVHKLGDRATNCVVSWFSRPQVYDQDVFKSMSFQNHQVKVLP
jgi:hypothetical protein